MDANKLLLLGQITSYLSILAPVPTFLMCNKSVKAQNKQIDTIQFSFLLVLFMISNLWLCHFEHSGESNRALVFVYRARTLATAIYVGLYLCVRASAGWAETWPYVVQTLITGILVALLDEFVDRSYLLAVTLFFEMLNNLIQVS